MHGKINLCLSLSSLPFQVHPSVQVHCPSASDTSKVSHAHETWLKLRTHGILIVSNLPQVSNGCYLVILITHNSHYRKRKSQTLPDKSCSLRSNLTWIICPNGFYHS